MILMTVALNFATQQKHIRPAYNVSNHSKENKMADKLLIPPQGGVLREIVTRLKLIGRLMGDRRVSIWLKLIPIGTLIYLVSPIDIIMGIPGLDALDDTAVIWMGNYLFLELCPPNVVHEHIQALSQEAAIRNGDNEGDVVDAEVKDVK